MHSDRGMTAQAGRQTGMGSEVETQKQNWGCPVGPEQEEG